MGNQASKMMDIAKAAAKQVEERNRNRTSIEVKTPNVTSEGDADNREEQDAIESIGNIVQNAGTVQSNTDGLIRADSDENNDSLGESGTEQGKEQESAAVTEEEQKKAAEAAAVEQGKDVYEIWDRSSDSFGEDIIKTRIDKLGAAHGLLVYFIEGTEKTEGLKEFMEKALESLNIEDLREHNEFALNFLRVKEQDLKELENDEDSIIKALLPFDIETFRNYGWNVFKCFWIWYESFINALYNDYITNDPTNRASRTNAYDESKAALQKKTAEEEEEEEESIEAKKAEMLAKFEKQLGGKENLEKSLKKAMDEIESIKQGFQEQDRITRRIRFAMQNKENSDKSPNFDYDEEIEDIRLKVKRENILREFESKIKQLGLSTDEFMWESDSDYVSEDDDYNSEGNGNNDSNGDDDYEASPKKKRGRKRRKRNSEESKVDRYKSLPKISVFYDEYNGEDGGSSYNFRHDEDDLSEPGTLKYLLSVNGQSSMFNKFSIIDKKNLLLLIYIEFLEDYLQTFEDGTEDEKENEIINAIEAEEKLASYEQADCMQFLQDNKNIDVSADLELTFSEEEKGLEKQLDNFVNSIGLDRGKLKKFKRHTSLEEYREEVKKQDEKAQQDAKSQLFDSYKAKLLTDKANLETLVSSLRALQGPFKKSSEKDESKQLKKYGKEMDKTDRDSFNELLSDAELTYKLRGTALKTKSLQTDENKFYYLRYIKGYCLRFLDKYKNEIAEQVANQDEVILSGLNKLQIIAVNLLLAQCNEEYERVRQILMEKLGLKKKKRIKLKDYNKARRKGAKQDKVNPSAAIGQESDSDSESEQDNAPNENQESKAPAKPESMDRAKGPETPAKAESSDPAKQSLPPVYERRLNNLLDLQNKWRYLRAKYRIMLMFMSKKVGLNIKTYREANLGEVGKDFRSTILDKINVGDSTFIDPSSSYVKAYMGDAGHILIKNAAEIFQRLASDLDDLQERYQERYLGQEYVDAIRDTESIINTAGSVGADIISDDALIIDKIPADAIGKI